MLLLAMETMVAVWLLIHLFMPRPPRWPRIVVILDFVVLFGLLTTITVTSSDPWIRGHWWVGPVLAVVVWALVTAATGPIVRWAFHRRIQQRLDEQERQQHS